MPAGDWAKAEPVPLSIGSIAAAAQSVLYWECPVFSVLCTSGAGEAGARKHDERAERDGSRRGRKVECVKVSEGAQGLEFTGDGAPDWAVGPSSGGSSGIKVNGRRWVATTADNRWQEGLTIHTPYE